MIIVNNPIVNIVLLVFIAVFSLSLLFFWAGFWDMKMRRADEDWKQIMYIIIALLPIILALAIAFTWIGIKYGLGH